MSSQALPCCRSCFSAVPQLISSGARVIDEFHLVRQSTASVKVLTSELHNAMNEKSQLISRRFYRDLLLGLERDPSVKITDLSLMVGFNSSNTFIRVFR